MAAVIQKIAWRIYMAPPETIFMLWTILVIVITAGVSLLVALLIQRATFKRMAQSWATDELKAAKAQNRALTALVEELEADNLTHSNVWTSLLATLSKTKGRKKSIISLNSEIQETETAI